MAETKAVSVQEKNITDEVLLRVNDLNKKGELVIPPGYSAANALKSAWLILQETTDKAQKPVLQACTKPSIANSLLDMVLQGLSPAKKQCYFVAYGNKLQMMRSWMGTVAATKRLKGVKEVFANCIYEGDEFEYQLDLDTGLKKITKHEQSFENIDPTKIKGAYAVVVKEDGQNFVEVMNIGQIRAAWNQGTAYKSGKSTAHNNFTDEMAKKTVINRACKIFVNTSDDSDIIINSFNNTITDEKRDDADLISNVDYEVHEEIKNNSNSKVIDIESKPAPEVENNQEQIIIEGPGF